MKVILAKNAGFCMGVERAVQSALQLCGKRYCVYGKLIHNEHIVRKLEQNGVAQIEHLHEAQDYDGVIIRSHGEPPKTYQTLQEMGKEIVDLTCPFVAKIHAIVKEHSQQGYKIVIIGDKNHAEVQGINGHCQNDALIVGSFDELCVDLLPQKVCVVVQTTFSLQKHDLIIKKIQNINNKTVEVFDTICYTTIARQQEAAILAQQCTKVLVIGSKSSSNTQKLVDICSDFCKTYLVFDVKDLEAIGFAQNDIVGIVAGASTHRELILEVFNYMTQDSIKKVQDDQIATDTQEPKTAESSAQDTPVAQEVQAEPQAEQAKAEEVATKEQAATVEPVEQAPVVEQAEAAAPTEQAEAAAPAEQAEEASEKKAKGKGKKKSEKEPEQVSAEGESKPDSDSALFRAEMAALTNKQNTPLKLGKKYKVEVLTIDEKGVYVALSGHKRDGYIPMEEAGIEEYKPSEFKIGEKIYAVLKSLSDKTTGCHILSKKDVDLEREADKAVDEIRDGREFSLQMSDETNGGLLGYIASYRVFVPSSHLREEGYPRDLKKFLQKPLRLTVLEIDDKHKKIVASQKNILLKERQEREDKFWSSINQGDIVKGKVLRVTSFGAFVGVNGMDCLAHIGDLSWNKINKAEDVVKIGETRDFLVLTANRETNKVSLGLKQLTKHPFEEIIEKYPAGSVVKGKVVRLVTFGAFVELEKGVDALLHLSEASHKYTKSISEVLNVGDEVEAMVIKIEPDKRKISLSIKALMPEEAAAPASDEIVLGEDERAENPKAKKEYKRPVVGEKKKPSKLNSNDGPREWSEDNSNNPFADLLKDFKE